MSSPQVENLEEKWFSFRRLHCMEGSIDIWTGDQADDPNLDNKSNIHINSSSVFFRLNGEGKWVNHRNLCGLLNDVYEYGAGFSANDLWYIAMLQSVLRVVPGTKEYCSQLLEEHGSAEAVLEWLAINQKKNG